MLTLTAKIFRNPQLAGYFSTANHSNFLHVIDSTAWLHDFPYFLTPLYQADKGFDRILIYYRDIVMFFDPITRQIFDYATPLYCYKKSEVVIALDVDNDER